MITPVTIAIARTQKMKPVRDPYYFWRDVAIGSAALYAFLVGVLV